MSEQYLVIECAPDGPTAIIYNTKEELEDSLAAGDWGSNPITAVPTDKAQEVILRTPFPHLVIMKGKFIQPILSLRRHESPKWKV